jgi:3-hydroxybutyryl-CoA dehydrogenase
LRIHVASLGVYVFVEMNRRDTSTPLRVLVLGAGRMGSQLACELALGGHTVTAAARSRDRLSARIDGAFATAIRYGLASSDAARSRVGVSTADAWRDERFDVVLESAPEDFDLKVSLLQAAIESSPDAILATNTSSLSITELGKAIGAGDRIVGTHFWNPPLLMPLVEVVSGEETPTHLAEEVADIIRRLGKTPVLVQRDVPGFIWNRLQMALLREALWLVENGVATPATVDLVVREGVARRARHTGPFETVALGGAHVWSAVAANLFPELSNADGPGELGRCVSIGEAEAREIASRRDRALARELADDR